MKHAHILWLIGDMGVYFSPPFKPHQSDAVTQSSSRKYVKHHDPAENTTF